MPFFRDIVAIDLGDRFVNLCKWDGRDLQIEKLPTADPFDKLAQWMDILSPRTGFRACIRPGSSQLASASFRDSFCNELKRCGANDCTIQEVAGECSPTIHAVRHFARRHRLTYVIAMGLYSTYGEFLTLDARHEVNGAASLTWPADSSKLPNDVGIINAVRQSVEQALRRSDVGLESVTWLVHGDRASRLAGRLAAACGFRSVLIPDHAAYFTALGMVISPLVLQFEESFTPRPIDVDELRIAIGRLMDRMADAVFREGYDLDDLVCDRYVRMGCANDAQRILVSCGGLTHAAALSKTFVRSLVRKRMSSSQGREVLVDGVMVRATIETPLENLPPPDAVKTTVNLDNSYDASRVVEDLILYRAELICAGRVNGPAAIHERFDTLIVPQDWYAEYSRAGGIWLRKQ